MLCLLKLRSLFQTTRRLLKKMGDSAGVGIEPEAQTLLCDATAELPGVVAAGVPGAGGVDAIFALT
jgi:phosphomevalonate kinase